MQLKHDKPTMLYHVVFAILTFGLGIVFMLAQGIWRDWTNYYSPICTICGNKNVGIFDGLFD